MLGKFCMTHLAVPMPRFKAGELDKNSFSTFNILLVNTNDLSNWGVKKEEQLMFSSMSTI